MLFYLFVALASTITSRQYGHAESSCKKLICPPAKQGPGGAQTQMRTGFNRVWALLDDYALDYPAARKQFAELQAAGEREGWLQPVADDTNASEP